MKAEASKRAKEVAGRLRGAADNWPQLEGHTTLIHPNRYIN